MRMYFLDSTDDNKHEYNQNGFARFHNQIIGTGVSDVESLEVSAKNNMEIALSSGWIFANGYALEIENTETLKHEVADPNNDRIDRIVIRFDTNPEKLDFYPVIKKGTPAGNPTPPSLTRDNYIYEMSVAQVRIKAGKSYVEDDEITDERENDAVCGYIPLHNIYRGLDINEYGMVTMPNQSYVKAETKETESFTGDKDVMNFGDIIEDKQKEVLSDNRTFKPKQDGVYHLWVEMAWDSGDMLEDIGLRVYIYVNGKESFPIAADYKQNYRDRFFMGSGVDNFKKDDAVTFVFDTGYRNDRDVPDTLFTRIRIAKLS